MQLQALSSPCWPQLHCSSNKAQLLRAPAQRYSRSPLIQRQTARPALKRPKNWNDPQTGYACSSGGACSDLPPRARFVIVHTLRGDSTRGECKPAAGFPSPKHGSSLIISCRPAAVWIVLYHSKKIEGCSQAESTMAHRGAPSPSAAATLRCWLLVAAALCGIATADAHKASRLALWI